MRDLFRDDNTDGYSREELGALNTEWRERAEAANLEEGTDEYQEAANAFCDNVARR